MEIVFPIIVIIVAGLIAYWGGSIGFFSALLHLGVVVVSGAIAFAAWEPLATFMAARMPLAFVNMAWGISLVLVFAISMAILDSLANKACPANVRVSDSVNFIGGIAAGAVSGTLTAGILLIGLQMIQGPSEIISYRGWAIDTEGSVVRQDSLWLPADKLTEMFYENASVSTMAAPDPLAKWHPQISQAASLYRESYLEGASRMGLRPNEVDVNRVVRVDLQDPEAYIAELRGAQDPYTLDPARTGDIYLIGLSVNFGAADDGERVRLTKAQVRLVVQDRAGKFVAVHPHAFIHRFATDLAQNSRWPFDTADVPAVSVGAGGDPEFAFEFVIPQDARPSHLLVRNIAFDLPNEIEELTPAEVVTEFDLLLRDADENPLPFPGNDNMVEYPGAGSISNPPHWQGMIVMALLFGVTMFLSMRPTKRTHQD